MTNDTWKAIAAKLEGHSILRGESAPFDEIDEASKRIGLPFPHDYREFLHRYGAAMVGAYPIFGVSEVEAIGTSWSVVRMNEHFRGMGWPGVEEWVLFSNDLGGNPFGFDGAGRVWLSDTDFGDIVQVAPNFEEFIRKKCLKL